MLCSDNGYNLNFEVYTRKKKDFVEKNLGASVVKRLTEDLTDKYHHLYFDNYFNSYNLQLELLDKNIYACGTVQAYRKHLPELKNDREMERGNFDRKISDKGIIFMKWKDAKCVYLLSSCKNNDVTQVGRRAKDGSTTQVVCPVAFI